MGCSTSTKTSLCAPWRLIDLSNEEISKRLSLNNLRCCFVEVGVHLDPHLQPPQSAAYDPPAVWTLAPSYCRLKDLKRGVYQKGRT
jgi:hypothetical protein